MITKETTKELTEAIRTLAGGTIFSCHFVKRTSGEERTMVCKMPAIPDNECNPSASPSRFFNNGLLLVWDMQKKGYRTVPLDSIQWIKIRGEVFT
jgi:hypothetical protein